MGLLNIDARRGCKNLYRARFLVSKVFRDEIRFFREFLPNEETTTTTTNSVTTRRRISKSDSLAPRVTLAGGCFDRDSRDFLR